MRTSFVASLFLALSLPVFAASLVARNNDTCPPATQCPPEKTCPPTPQLCSTCPRQNNAGSPLLAAGVGAAYVHCGYKDTDCWYWIPDHIPPSEANTLQSGYPANACPQRVGAEVCSDPLPPIPPVFLTTRCPGTNLAFYNEPLANEVTGNANGYIQCHYPSSECYYLTDGSLVEGPSIPKASPNTVPPTPASCRPNLAELHNQVRY